MMQCIEDKCGADTPVRVLPNLVECYVEKSSVEQSSEERHVILGAKSKSLPPNNAFYALAFHSASNRARS